MTLLEKEITKKSESEFLQLLPVLLALIGNDR
jgi:hypothetical protein